MTDSHLLRYGPTPGHTKCRVSWEQRSPRGWITDGGVYWVQQDKIPTLKHSLPGCRNVKVTVLA